MRPRYAWMFLAAIASAALGCATGSSSRPTTSLFRKPAPTVAQNEETKKPDSVAKSDNPFRKGDVTSESKKSTAEPKTSTQPTTAKNDSSKTSFPSATQQLIDAELADATPEEKADWLDRLQRVDPAMIP